MRKVLLFTLCLVCSLATMAQTSMDTALDLTMGTVTYEFTESGSVYYKYTAPEESGVLLTIARPDYSASISVMDADRNYFSSISQNSGMTNIYAVGKGKTAYVVVSVYSACTATFEASVEEAEVEGGETCDDPLIATDGSKIYVPVYRSSDYSSYYSTYIAYDATEDGVMQVDLTGYANSFTVSVGCDGEKSSPTGSYQNGGGYQYKFDVDGGNRYIVAIQGYSPQFATFTLTHPTVGSSCDMPFTASTETENTLPAAAGSYWYQLTPSKSGYAVISSDATLVGGTVKGYSYCGAYTTSGSVTGSMLFRSPVYSGSSLMICIEKAEATAADETFSISIEDAKEGDTYDNPMTLNIGENVAPMYNGTYYYKLEVPEGDAKMLKIDASDAGILSSNTNVALYSSSDSYTSIAYGQSSLSKDVTGGSTYIVRWVLDEGKNGFTFNVELEDIAAGDVASNPIHAVEGENALANGTVKYYDFVSTKSGWLSIDVADPSVSVSFPINPSNSYSGNYSATTEGTVSRIQATAGTTYYLVFRGMTEDTSFTLSQDDYAQGESKDNPIEITEETTALPEKVTDYWYVYTAPRDGKLVVKSDIEYGYNSSYTYTQVSVAINDGYESSITKYSSGGTVFDGSFAVSAGDKAYIHVVIPMAQTGKTLTCYVADYEKGETSSNPIELEDGEMTIPYVSSRDASVWYSVELNQNDSLNISGSSYFGAYLYKADDLNNYVTYATSYYDSSTYTSIYYLAYKHEAEESTKYLVNVYYSYGETPVTVTIVRAKTDGIDTIDAANASACGVFDMQGRKVAEAKSINAANLPAGIYIMNGKKVVVK